MTLLAYRLMLLMVFTMPWEDVLSFPGAGSVSRLIGLVTGMVWVLSVVSRGEVRAPRKPHLFAVLFVLWNACTLLWTADGPATQERVLTYVQDLALLMIVWDTVTTPRRVRQTLLAYLAGCCVAALSLVIGYLTVGAGYNGRATLGAFNPNDVSMLLALGLPIAVYVMLSAGGGSWSRVQLVMGLLYVPLSGYAILMTGSRAALGALLPGLAYLGYRSARRRPDVAAGALVGLMGLAVLAYPLAPPKVRLHLEGTTDEIASGDLNERGGIWAEAIRLISDNPLFGTGAASFREAAVGANKVGHNFALSLWAETGLVGLVLFMAILISALVSLQQVKPLLRDMWLALFSAWMVAALLHNWEYRKQTWLFLALAIACSALETRRQARPPGSQERSDVGRSR